MFVPVHMCGAHRAVAVDTSVPCMLDDLYLDPDVMCMYFALWLYRFISCPSVSVQMSRCTCMVTPGDHVLFHVLGSICFSESTHLSPWYTAGVKLYFSRCAHMWLVHILLTAKAESVSVRAQACACGSIAGVLSKSVLSPCLYHCLLSTGWCPGENMGAVGNLPPYPNGLATHSGREQRQRDSCWYPRSHVTPLTGTPEMSGHLP